MLTRVDASDKVSRVANNGSVNGGPRLRPVTNNKAGRSSASLVSTEEVLLKLLTRQHDFMHRYTIAPQGSVHRASSAAPIPSNRLPHALSTLNGRTVTHQPSRSRDLYCTRVLVSRRSLFHRQGHAACDDAGGHGGGTGVYPCSYISA